MPTDILKGMPEKSFFCMCVLKKVLNARVPISVACVFVEFFFIFLNNQFFYSPKGEFFQGVPIIVTATVKVHSSYLIILVVLPMSIIQ